MNASALLRLKKDTRCFDNLTYMIIAIRIVFLKTCYSLSYHWRLFERDHLGHHTPSLYCTPLCLPTCLMLAVFLASGKEFSVVDMSKLHDRSGAFFCFHVFLWASRVNSVTLHQCYVNFFIHFRKINTMKVSYSLWFRKKRRWINHQARPSIQPKMDGNKRKSRDTTGAPAL